MNINTTYCGFVAIVGRSNVGKSTLLNKLLGQKVSITSRKPQTTRHRILGIKTDDIYQIIYIDTPGLHLRVKNKLSILMNRRASSSMNDVDLIIFVVEGIKWTKDDELVLSQLYDRHCRVVLVINQIDKVADKNKLLKHMNLLDKKSNFHAIILACALNGIGVNILADVVRKELPIAHHLFPNEYITDCSPCFMAAEIIREKLIRFLGDELPYSVTVKIESFTAKKNYGYEIKGMIYVERTGQKKILIGNQGQKIKKISIEARQAMKALFKTSIYLELWVKVKSKWTNDQHALRSLGYVSHI
ncbi:GTPase Era [Candidatus Palibaumannia cicadellinicola]|uniref:GTPase Era n=1 Tax=Baumannia cicadellinicola subsp. Homalodisca coagulata TaxID=374463 RepID=Q1LTI4_BAUCH|nr:GTPase Era [Candidatus Baumannia cicadellinicola]ABF14119.1 GTP-binding protein Era [Baumannia cicadellinicola str. Hc (Homalodisca coagulata)]MBS0032721.1 GTPase Era [Candidatus Baumannia cicadellinicola]MCJ7462287.1 GTPase Era [Candidatus Baumannia cicadellinicola]MCJ7462807.1 GTPase Era [Candidatus Baumannia cicadellinicola]